MCACSMKELIVDTPDDITYGAHGLWKTFWPDSHIPGEGARGGRGKGVKGKRGGGSSRGGQPFSYMLAHAPQVGIGPPGARTRKGAVPVTSSASLGPSPPLATLFSTSSMSSRVTRYGW